MSELFIIYYWINVEGCGPVSVVDMATGYGLDGPGFESRWGARFSAPVHTGPGAHPASCTIGTASFPGVKRGRGVMLTPHPLLVPWSRKGRAIPLLHLWVVRPVQSLSACTMVHFTFTLPTYTTGTFQSFQNKSNVAPIGTQYSYGQIYTNIQKTPTEIQVSKHWNPSGVLRHRPAVFFQHIRLTAISFPQENIRRVFHKSYNCITYAF